jgi:hypothetical protein
MPAAAFARSMGNDAGMDYWAAFQKCGLLAFFRAPIEK